jgi:transposase
LTQALEGRVKAHHRFVLTELLCQIDSLDETIAHFDQKIEQYCCPFEEAVVLLDTIPGIARETTEIIISEIGTDMSRFPSAHHLASWAGVAPGNNESAGKKRSGRTTQGNKPLGVALNQVAHAAAHTRNTYLSAQYHRLAGHRGKKRAIMAVAHSILVIAYHMLKNHVPCDWSAVWSNSDSMFLFNHRLQPFRCNLFSDQLFLPGFLARWNKSE